MVRRKKTTLFLDAKETTTVGELKKMIEGITKKDVKEQKLYNREEVVSPVLKIVLLPIIFARLKYSSTTLRIGNHL